LTCILYERVYIYIIQRICMYCIHNIYIINIFILRTHGLSVQVQVWRCMPSLYIRYVSILYAFVIHYISGTSTLYTPLVLLIYLVRLHCIRLLFLLYIFIRCMPSLYTSFVFIVYLHWVYAFIMYQLRLHYTRLYNSLYIRHVFIIRRATGGRALLLLYCCFTAALLLLYCCFTAALLLLYRCFTTPYGMSSMTFSYVLLQPSVEP